ncbi:endonuclease III domain-containing protein [Candidatus Bipolaricaulota bacterium]
MNRTPLDLIGLHEALLQAYGPQDWWPGREDPFEVIVGAILTQRTTWTNVASVIEALRSAELLTFEAIRMAEDRRLEDLIRPTGFFRAKTIKLKAFCSLLRADYDGDLSRLFALPLAELRTWLLSVHGIGDETADAILVYAAGKASFVIDAYTRRLLTRLGSIAGNESYQWLQDAFAEALPADVSLFAEYHALIVHHAKTHCLSRPRCDGCPLAYSCDFAKQGEESG